MLIMLRALFCASLIVAAVGTSLSSCGSASDQLIVKNIAVSPDPIQKGEPFNIVLNGEFQHVHSGGRVTADLNIIAFRVFKKNVNTQISYNLSPSLPQGNTSVAIGPITLPTSLPGRLDITGEVNLVDSDSQPVACFNMAFHVPARPAENLARGGITGPVEATGTVQVNDAKGEPITCIDVTGANCKTAQDHAQKVQIATGDDGTETVTFTMDERFDSLTALVDLEFKAWILSVPLSVSVPVSYKPGLPAGDFKWVFSPSSGSTQAQVV